MDKHFAIEVTDDEIRWSRKQDKINAEAQLDGIYVIRTSLQSSALGCSSFRVRCQVDFQRETVCTQLSLDEAVEAYKSLAHVERAFRSLKTAGLQGRVGFTDQLVEQLDQRVAQLGGGAGVQLGV